ncbi:hypothetical protein CSHISOI_09737 [Colletotrichum shisoi]|uniref:Secreted protein n=1 Tax=Colletotrichum shisoi TaxID=2078593 RepID=A0A5Q4BG55_9PEZI|nr:hypothetical protein CSHISOI_09737 [Colletotrichum shisoi]
MHLLATTLLLGAAVVFQGLSARLCTGPPPPDCNFEDEEMLPSQCCSGALYCPAQSDRREGHPCGRQTAQTSTLMGA